MTRTNADLLSVRCQEHTVLKCHSKNINFHPRKYIGKYPLKMSVILPGFNAWKKTSEVRQHGLIASSLHQIIARIVCHVENEFGGFCQEASLKNGHYRFKQHLFTAAISVLSDNGLVKLETITKEGLMFNLQGPGRCSSNLKYSVCKLIFTRGQFWHLGIVVACDCLSVCVCVSTSSFSVR